ncbi:MAG: single-stranded-DNA-specific exonuclease RecJ [Eubacteriales bacterium]|nr:single-stranded-DNA-specific exonuclease RecJ [Eubacteriales bacterium]
MMLKDTNNDVIAGQIASHFGLNKVIADILVSRNIDTLDKADAFLYPKQSNMTPLELYVGLDGVVERIKQAVDNKEKVVLYGDYDCDGICGVSILYLYLQSRGVDVSYFLPSRHTHGYGLSIEALESIAEQSFPDLIVTVDCGISSKNEVQYAQEVLGIDVVVTDHHEPIAELPECNIFNPKLSKGCFRELCGAGVALRLVEALAGVQESKKYYDIAAIATVADIVPLVEDNRIIVYYGLMLINRGYRKGVKMLVERCVKGVVKSSDISYKIAPRINSVGRLQDANPVVELFVSNDNFVLSNMIEEIEKLNDLRQTMTTDLATACDDRLIGFDFEDNPIIVLYDRYWDDGILGIASARLVGEFNRPVILLTKNKGVVKGSGRSVEGVNILDCVSACSDILLKFGGHKMACGLSLQEDNVEEFIRRINAFAKSTISSQALQPKVEAFCKLDDFDIEFAKQLAYLEPYGEGNREVTFSTDMGKCDFAPIGNSEHLKYHYKDSDFLAFSAIDKLSLLNSSAKKKIRFSLSVNAFKNTETLQANVLNVTCNDVECDMGVANYVMQSIYKSNSPIQVRHIDKERAFDAIADSSYGTCYLCYDYDTFKSIDPKIIAKLRINNGFCDSDCPYNRLIYNPDVNVNLTYYDNIVLLERPLSGALTAKMQISKDASVWVVDDDIMQRRCRNKLLDYAGLGKVFTAIKTLLAAKSYTDYYTLFQNIGVEGVAWEEFCVAMAVFVDLGIVKYDNNAIIIDREVKTKLDCSKLYRVLSK